MERKDSENWRSFCEQVEHTSEPMTFMEFVFSLLKLPNFEQQQQVEEE